MNIETINEYLPELKVLAQQQLFKNQKLDLKEILLYMIDNDPIIKKADKDGSLNLELKGKVVENNRLRSTCIRKVEQRHEYGIRYFLEYNNKLINKVNQKQQPFTTDSYLDLALQAFNFITTSVDINVENIVKNPEVARKLLNKV